MLATIPESPGRPEFESRGLLFDDCVTLDKVLLSTYQFPYLKRKGIRTVPISLDY